MNEPDLHVGIFGPGLCGKTTLAKQLSRAYWQGHGIKSIALDIHREDWGPQCWVTGDSSKFEQMVWLEKSCAVFIDESTDTIDRAKDKTKFFTRIRHQGHKLHVIGHDGASLLPVMRQQIQTLFLFRLSFEPAKKWAEQFANRDIMEACNLGRREFLWCRYYEGTAEKRTLTL